MANNTGGRILRNLEIHTRRLVKEIDKRTDNGKDRENVDPIWQKHKTTSSGERVWSF